MRSFFNILLFHHRKTVPQWAYQACLVSNTVLLLIIYTQVLNHKAQADYTNNLIKPEVTITEHRTETVVKYVVPETIEEKIKATFPEDPDTAVRIAKCESGMRPNAFNGSNTNGSTDSGLMQINSIHGVSKHMLMDVDINLAVARVIYERAGNSFSPWVCYKK